MVGNNQGTTDQQTEVSLEDKRQFALSSILIMAQHTAPYVCSIMGVVDQRTGCHCGSALRCILNGKRSIVTAFHVIEAAKSVSGDIAISAGYGRVPFVVHGEIHVDPIADLAVYVVPDGFPLASMDFWPTDRIDRDLDRISTDYLFLHGFPGARSYSSQVLNGVFTKSLPYGAMQKLENLPSDLRSYQFAIEYDPNGMTDETGEAAELVDPSGLSGSPVWRIGASGRNAREWVADDCLLVGIVTEWRPTERVLVATSTRKILMG